MFIRAHRVSPKKRRAKTVLYSPVSIGVSLLALILLAINLSYSELPLNGRLMTSGGQVTSVTDNDIVVNKGDMQNAAYYNLGFVSPEFEGYTVDPDNIIKSDENEFERCFLPYDESSGIYQIYICGTKYTDAHFLNNLPEPTDMGGITDDTENIISGVTYYTSDNGNTFGGYFTTTLKPDVYNGKYYKYFAAYIPAKYDCSVLIHVISKADTPDALSADYALIDAAKAAADIITIYE